MQSRRWPQHGSSGELDVFGATRYFTGGRADCATHVAQPAADRLTQQPKVVMQDRMTESFRGHHDDDEQLVGIHDLRYEKEMELAKPAGESKLSAFSSFMVSTSPGASFRRRPPPPSPSTKSTAAGDESVKLSLPTAAPRRSSDDLIGSSVANINLPLEEGLDLGVATGDRRLQGVKVVRGSGADEERWVVRCTSSCWDHQGEKVEAASRNYLDRQVEEEEDSTSPFNWESDSSSELFDLDIEYVDL